MPFPFIRDGQSATILRGYHMLTFETSKNTLSRLPMSAIVNPEANIFEQDLPRTEANYAALSPLAFIERSAEVYPERLAVVHGELRRTWAEVFSRCRQLASALVRHGIGKGDTVAVMLPNTPPMVDKIANSQSVQTHILQSLQTFPHQ